MRTFDAQLELSDSAYVLAEISIDQVRDLPAGGNGEKI